jgi:hypothetical protein
MRPVVKPPEGHFFIDLILFLATHVGAASVKAGSTRASETSRRGETVAWKLLGLIFGFAILYTPYKLGYYVSPLRFFKVEQSG